MGGGEAMTQPQPKPRQSVCVWRWDQAGLKREVSTLLLVSVLENVAFISYLYTTVRII